MVVPIQESYSSKIVNQVESIEINGIDYTKFYTELNTNLSVGDYVYILNGNYDNSKLIEDNEYQKGSTGYKILEVTTNSITLDIPFRDKNPWNEDSFEDYCKVYLVDNLDKFNYENVDNSFGFELFAGEKFSTLNNNIFLSKIENLPYTIEDQTKDKFFKSHLSDGPDVLMKESRGQIFNDSSTLNFELEETSVYGITNSNGITGSTALRMPNGLNFTKDFDFNIADSDLLVSLVSASVSTDSSIWVLNKLELTVTDCEVKDTSNTTIVNSHIIKSLHSDNSNFFTEKNNLNIFLPNNTNGIYYRKRFVSGTVSSVQTQGIPSGYEVNGLGENVILGYSDIDTSTNYKSWGFYAQTSIQTVPNPDNSYTISSGSASISYLSGTTTTPHFVMAATQGGLGTYIQEAYFPDGKGHVNVVPHTGEFIPSGNPSKIEINDWINSEDGSQNLELAFLGTGERGATNSVDKSGIYFYSYAGNYKNQINMLDYFGNAFSFSEETFTKYKSGMWQGARFNPFQKFDSYEIFEHITDIEWIGIELNNFDGLDLYADPSGYVSPGQGIWYSKYLVISDAGTFYIYINMNGDLLRNNVEFDIDVTNLDIPQVHFVIEPITLTVGEFGSETPITYDVRSSVIGTNREHPSDTEPLIHDGEYPIGSIVYSDVTKTSINKSFNFVNFYNASVTSIDHEDERWLISTATFSTRFGTSGSGTSEGLFIYDSLIGSNTTQFNIDTLYAFDIGNQLPSNEVYRIKSELFDGKRRVWASTDQGIFMFDYELDFFYQYYYSIDFDNNEIPLDETLYKNNRLYIMENFVYDGINFNKGDVYKWSRDGKSWLIDVTYLPAYLTKSHFKDGSFLPDSTLNDGIFGNRDTTANWLGSGASWRNGILYNSIWNEGTMGSKSDELSAQNHYAERNNGGVVLTTDFTNNHSYGYNLSIKSSILTGIVDNGNFINCIIGSDNDTSLLNQTYLGNTFSFSDIKINKGSFTENDIYSTVMENSKIELSTLNKSEVKSNSRVINTDGNDSILSDVQIENKGRIKVTGYDKWYNLRNGLTDTDVIQVHKFFIEEKDFNELEFEDQIIFNNIKIDNTNPTNILDQLFHVLGGSDGYYADVYEDLNRISTSGDIKYTTNEYKVFISKKIKTQNQYKSVISFNGTTLEVNKVLLSDPKYSIDLSIVSNTIPYNSSSSVYLNSLKNDGILKISAIDISRSTIQTNKFTNCWVNGGEWINGSMINPNQILNKFNIGTMSTIDIGGTMSISVDLNDINYEIKSNNLLSVGSIIHLDNVWDTSFTEYVGGNYKVISMSTNSVVISPYSPIGLGASTELTPPISQYTSLNLNRVDGLNNDLSIKGGLFKNQSLSNVTISNEDLDLNLTFDNIRNLMIINTEITKRDNNTILSGFFGHGEITNDYGTSSSVVNLLGYKQVFNNVTINGGYITKSSFLNGTFNDGTFIGNMYNRTNDLLPINNRTYLTGLSAVVPSWVNGTFNNGVIDKSIWIDGTFNNGKFLNSEFLDGTFNNGIFGDPSTRSTLNLFRKGHWYNGTFENGILGDNSLRVSDVNSIYATSSYLLSSDYYRKDGTIIWEDGNFNNGLFSSIDNNVSLWKNGNFNNGQMVDSSIWYDGVFNNGKFKSTYGRYTANVEGETDLLSIAASSDVSATSSEYGSRAMNLQSYYNTSLNFLNKYNIGTIRNKHDDNIFNNPGTLVLDLSDYQLKYGYVSDISVSLKDSFSNDNSSHGYGEKSVNDYYVSPGSNDLHLQFKRVDYKDTNTSERNPIYNSNTIGSKLYVQDNGSSYIYDGYQYTPSSIFLSGTISNTSLTFSSDYAWRGGIFNNGEFGDPLNQGNENPSWENGTFNGGKFYGKIWKNGTLIKGDFNGSGLDQSQTSLNDIFKGYDPQSTMEQYIDDFSSISIGTFSTSQDNYKNILDHYKWFGIWLDGQVSPNINEFDISERVYENTLVEYFRSEKYRRIENKQVNFRKSLWVSGNFNNVDGNFDQSVWLSGTFSNGQFNNSMFNPYVQRWDFETGDVSNIKFTFELDTDLSVWNNGTFNSGVFYYSNWNNGTFNNGTMVGGLFKDGLSNYISSFSSIWEGGRHRNGNWYGSNFTIDNVYNTNGVPNPFEYLGQYFIDVQYPPFITDILSNNSGRIQDDRLHIWNTIDGTQTIQDYDMTDHDFGSSNYLNLLQNDNPLTSLTNPFVEYYFGMDNVSSPSGVTASAGIVEFNMDIHSTVVGSIYSNNVPFTFNLTDVNSPKLPEGSYRIKFYTNLTETWTMPSTLTSYDFRLYADIFDNGVLTQSNVLLKTITTNSSNVSHTFTVLTNQEYKLRVWIDGTTDGTYINDQKIFLEVDAAINDIYYTPDNNTLNGYIESNWLGDYLNSDVATVSATMSFINNIGISSILKYCSYDITTISVPTGITASNGAYTQYGNGSFQEGIWENGVWNNGYRGVEYGTYLTASGTGVFTYGSGDTGTVSMNQLYLDNPKYKFRTSPIIYFNDVQRSFKTTKDTWRFVLESSFNIDGTDADSYNKLNVGDKVSVGNIVAIDINGDRKLIKDIFTVIELTSNRATLEYKETFPIESLQIDSYLHLIYVTKNIWSNGAFLNGYFEGVMNNGYIKGNRELTKLEDSHLIDVRFEGGRLIGVKYDLTNAFDNTTNAAQSLSPQFVSKYASKYHSTVVQNMIFNDDVTIGLYEMISPESVQVIGGTTSRSKEITYSGTSSSPAVQYVYNSDIDVVYEPETFTSLFNQNIINSHILNKSAIGVSLSTKLYNVPSGYISLDILSSSSKFKYSLKPDSKDEIQEYDINLGIKYKEYDTISDADFSKSPEDNLDIDIPSTYNIINSGTYGISKKPFNSSGITFGDSENQDIHEEFMYIYGSSSLITGDNEFRTRGRYHLVEVDVEFKNELIINPYVIGEEYNLNATYSYSGVNLPKLSIGVGYNEQYEVNGGTMGYLSTFDSDQIPFIDGRKLSGINSYGNELNRVTMRSYVYNNFGGYRDSVKVIEKDFTPDGSPTGSTIDINSPVYHKMTHTQIDQVPFFNYKDYLDPITGTISEWNMSSSGSTNQDLTRKLDSRVKIPFYATSVPTQADSDIVLTDNINFLGGTNITGDGNVVDLDIFVTSIDQSGGLPIFQQDPGGSQVGPGLGL